MNVFISGITSDIGAYICRKYIEGGHNVIGTYRKHLDKALETQILKGGALLYCDFEDKGNIDAVISEFAKLGLKWDIFISAVGIMDPIASFEEVSIDLWEKNIYVNTVSQMRLLHGMLPYRREKEACVYFMTSKGINDTFPLHSAYCISKIMLIKMCELLDDEIDDCKFIAFNPGFIRTKIINQEPGIYVSDGANVKDNDYNQLELEKVWKFILWSSKIEKKVISGRNYFVKYDNWESEEFSDFLERDGDAYKLRRSKDQWNEK